MMKSIVTYEICALACFPQIHSLANPKSFILGKRNSCVNIEVYHFNFHEEIFNMGLIILLMVNESIITFCSSLQVVNFKMENKACQFYFVVSLQYSL